MDQDARSSSYWRTGFERSLAIRKEHAFTACAQHPVSLFLPPDCTRGQYRRHRLENRLQWGDRLSLHVVAANDDDVVAVSQAHELRYWAKKLRCGAGDLSAAVEAVGRSLPRVRQYLSAMPKRSSLDPRMRAALALSLLACNEKANQSPPISGPIDERRAPLGGGNQHS